MCIEWPHGKGIKGMQRITLVTHFFMIVRYGLNRMLSLMSIIFLKPTPNMKGKPMINAKDVLL